VAFFFPVAFKQRIRPKRLIAAVYSLLDATPVLVLAYSFDPAHGFRLNIDDETSPNTIVIKFTRFSFGSV